MKNLSKSDFAQFLGVLGIQLDTRNTLCHTKLAPSFMPVTIRGLVSELTDSNVVQTFKKCTDLLKLLGSELKTETEGIEYDSVDSLETMAKNLAEITRSMQALIDSSTDENNLSLQMSSLRLARLIEEKLYFCHRRADAIQERAAKKN